MKFNIIEYISGLTGFIFDKSVLVRIAMERGVINATSISDIDNRTKDLLTADLLLTVYLSPNSSASFQKSHGTFSKSVGSQTITDKQKIYNMMLSLYKKWNDDKLNIIQESDGYLQWLE